MWKLKKEWSLRTCPADWCQKCIHVGITLKSSKSNAYFEKWFIYNSFGINADWITEIVGAWQYLCPINWLYPRFKWFLYVAFSEDWLK